MLLQQGDVLITKINKLPKNLVNVKSKRKGYVIAEGEATGHAHVISDIDNCELYEKDGVLFLKTIKPVELKHEEHKPFNIPIGDFEIGIVKEYDHFEEEARNVMD